MFFCFLHCLHVVVDGVCMDSSSAECCEGKSSHIAAAIENVSPSCDRAHERSHIALVQEKSGLLADCECNLKLQSVLTHHDSVPRRSPQPVLLRFESFVFPRGARRFFEDTLRFAEVSNRIDEPWANSVHPQCRELHHHHI